MLVSAREPHFFILSNAGKPIFSSHAIDEQALISFTGLIQAIVSCTQSSAFNDPLQTIHSGQMNLIFYLKSPVYLVALVRQEDGHHVAFLERQLHLLYHQIVFILSAKGIQTLASNPSYDLRTLLDGTQPAMNSLLLSTATSPDLLFQAFQALPLDPTRRYGIAKLLSKSTVPDLLYSILLYQSKIVAFVQTKTRAHALPVGDLMLLSNFVTKMTSFRLAESWTPVCFPHFNDKGFLQAYVGDICDDYCLVLVTPTQSAEQFHLLQQMKAQIVEHLQLSGLLPTVEERQQYMRLRVEDFQIERLWHFVYHVRSKEQCFSPVFSSVLDTRELQATVWMGYQKLHYRIQHSKAKFLSERSSRELFLAIASPELVLYATFNPLLDVDQAMQKCTELLHMLRREHDHLFMSFNLTLST